MGGKRILTILSDLLRNLTVYTAQENNKIYRKITKFFENNFFRLRGIFPLHPEGDIGCIPTIWEILRTNCCARGSSKGGPHKEIVYSCKQNSTKSGEKSNTKLHCMD